MTIRLEHRTGASGAASPWRLVADPGGEIEWVNRYLDLQRVRGLAELSIRYYGSMLLHFLRWWASTGVDVTRLDLGNFTEATLVDYVRAQREQLSPPPAETINARAAMLERLFRFHFGEPMPHSPARIVRAWWRPPGAPRRRSTSVNLKVRVEQRVIEPLSREQVQQFWESFHTARDIAIVALMLFNGLRSCEVLGLDVEDYSVREAQARVRGKRSKVQVLPLAPETMRLLESYRTTERPLSGSSRLFVSLKGKARGKPMTAAGLRSLFRYHRAQAGVGKANPHRFGILSEPT